jgi:hypothetical protein
VLALNLILLLAIACALAVAFPARERSWRARRHIGSRALVVLVVLSLVGTVAAVVARPASASTGADTSSMFALTNQTRAAVGLPALQWDPAAAAVASAWATNMASTNVLAHNPSLVAQIDAQVTTAWTHLGENVGVAPNTGVLEALFVASPGHYANIIGNYNRVGVGSARDSRGNLWVTLDFVTGPAIASADPSALLPFGSSADLVTQQYNDLLGRQPDAAGMAFWRSQLDLGLLDGGSVAAGMLTSQEFAGTVGPLAKLYLAVFGRLPDAQGLLFWLRTERAGTSLSEIAADFGLTPEYRAIYGSSDPVTVVTVAYLHVFARQPDPSGLAYWTGLLRAGTLRATDFLLQLAMSPEFGAQTNASVQVDMVYVGMLRRSADPSGFAYWLGQVQSSGTLSWLTRTFFASPEYAARF